MDKNEKSEIETLKHINILYIKIKDNNNICFVFDNIIKKKKICIILFILILSSLFFVL